jgi:hypothetical protein
MDVLVEQNLTGEDGVRVYDGQDVVPELPLLGPTHGAAGGERREKGEEKTSEDEREWW